MRRGVVLPAAVVLALTAPGLPGFAQAGTAPLRPGKSNISVPTREQPAQKAPPPVPEATREATAPTRPSAPQPWHAGLFTPATIYVEPLALTAEPDRQLLREAAAQVQDLFEVRVEVRLPEAPRPDLPNVHGEPYREGDVLSFPSVAAAMQYTWWRQPGLPDALAVIAVSGAPIAFPAQDGRLVESATWSMRGQGIAAVSLPLLLKELERSALPEDRARDRLAKAMARMLGQALGLSESAGLMRRPNAPPELDARDFRFAPVQRAELRIVRGLCAVADGRAAAGGVEAALHARAENYDDPAAAALLAIMLERRDVRGQASGALDDALAATPAIARLHLSRARLAYRSGDWTGAADAWDRVLELQPHAPAWAAGRPVDWLLTRQGLPGRADGGATPVWREPLEQARGAVESGDTAVAADAARDALTRELEIGTHADRALFAGRNGAVRTGDIGIGSAAGTLAVASALNGAWDTAAEALTLAREHLSAQAGAQLEHVAIRIAVGRGTPAAWDSPDRTSRRDRLRAGLEAQAAGELVSALEAWSPLLAELDTPWAPNVPVAELARVHLDQGDAVRARDVLVRAGQAGLLAGHVREMLARVPMEPPPAPAWVGVHVRRYSVRRFRPVVDVSAAAAWLGTTDGLSRIDRKTGKATLQHVGQGLPQGTITAVAAAKGAVWLGTTAGLYRRADDGEWTRFSDHAGLPVPAVTALLAEDNGTVLAGTVGGVCRATPDGRVWWPEGLPRGRVAALTQRQRVAAASFTNFGPAVRRGGLWQRIAAPNPGSAGTHFGGIALDELGRMVLVQSLPAATAICRETPFAVYCDDLPAGTAVVGPVAAPNGRLWLAADREIAQWDQAAGWEPLALLPEGEAGPILAIHPDPEEGLWVVTPHKTWRLVDGTFTVMGEYAARNIWRTLLPDPRGGVWRVFDGALYPPPGVEGPRALPLSARLPTPHSILVDQSGAPWAVADGRLYKGNGAVWTTLADAPAATGLLRVWAVVRGRLWASDRERVWMWDAVGGWTAVEAPDGVPTQGPRVRGIVATGDGRVCIAWADRVQVIAGEVRDVTELPRRTLLGLAATEDALWVATAYDGVYRVGAAPGHWTRADGLPDNRISAIAARGNVVWVAGAQGGVARWDGERWVRHHVGNLDAPLVAQAIVPTAGGDVWFQVGESWYEHEAGG